jgi:hypothetical protein
LRVCWFCGEIVESLLLLRLFILNLQHRWLSQEHSVEHHALTYYCALVAETTELNEIGACYPPPLKLSNTLFSLLFVHRFALRRRRVSSDDNMKLSRFSTSTDFISYAKCMFDFNSGAVGVDSRYV